MIIWYKKRYQLQFHYQIENTHSTIFSSIASIGLIANGSLSSLIKSLALSTILSNPILSGSIMLRLYKRKNKNVFQFSINLTYKCYTKQCFTFLRLLFYTILLKTILKMQPEVDFFPLLHLYGVYYWNRLIYSKNLNRLCLDHLSNS